MICIYAVRVRGKESRALFIDALKVCCFCGSLRRSERGKGRAIMVPEELVDG